MNKEEKAKAYDEAIKKAKKDLQVCEQDCLVAKQIFRYFPELAESEDEKIRKELLAVVNDLVLPDEQQSRFVSWLEKQGEQKPAWSEEDENNIDTIISVYHPSPKIVNWLKSLKQRYTWKPSDEQIEILNMVLTNESMDDNIARILRELREQLKKLMKM